MIEISDLEVLQLDLQHFLLSHHQLRFLVIERVRPRNDAEASGLQSKLDKLLAGMTKRNGKAGVALIITMPSLEGVEANVRAINGDTLISIDVIENLFINEGADGTGGSCETWALMIMRLLQHQTFMPHNPIVSAPKPLTPVTEAVIERKVMYRLNLTVPYVAAQIPKVADPAIEQAGSSISLSCGTAGAAIYYTWDGSFPGPGNEAALTYSAPLSMDAGVHILRTAAFAADMAGSTAVRARLTISA